MPLDPKGQLEPLVLLAVMDRQGSAPLDCQAEMEDQDPPDQRVLRAAMVFLVSLERHSLVKEVPLVSQGYRAGTD